MKCSKPGACKPPDEQSDLSKNMLPTLKTCNCSWRVLKHKVTKHICCVYILVMCVFILEIVLSFYLFSYISGVDSKLSIVSHQVELGAIVKRRSKRDNTVLENTVSNTAESNVEFFNPKLRQELEDKDGNKLQNGSRKASSGQTGETESPTNPWVWLTSYSRIPLVAIQGFCSATREYCPPGHTGPTGPPGNPGQRGDGGIKGDRGDRGFPGDMGQRGPNGMPGDPGPRGPRGDSGPPGASGLDGRDGVPGEPGLDGIPGRNGLDGVPGNHGLAGENGIPGNPGTNGTDGIPGSVGPIGPPGPQGYRGLAGPRGRPGKPGLNGVPGIPGVRAWEVAVNGSKSSELLIPPSIVGSEAIFATGPTIVQEKQNVRLRCAVTGTPRPMVQWRRLDTSVIALGSWAESSVIGHTLNITRINREHMGTYMCIADNGIPPPANKTFVLEVHFSPLIRIHSQLVGAVNESTTRLHCEVEAYPEAVRYWERHDGRLLEHSDKYRVGVHELGKYKSTMQLNITKMSSSDYGAYHCIAKNEMGITRGIFNVFEINPELATPPSVNQGIGEGEPAVYGVRPPERVDLNDLCPPPAQCPECPDTKECMEGLSDLLGNKELDVRPLTGNISFPGMSNRTLDCQVYAVGKPVYHRYTNTTYGSWMRDSQPRGELDNDKLWVTHDSENFWLFEYLNKTVFKNDIHTKKYRLEHPFSGNAHLVFNGSFYYNMRNRPILVRYDLTTERSQSFEVPYAVINETNLLYTTRHSYMDLCVDDNGLWVIYALSEPNNTAVIKVDPRSLQIEFSWNISVQHQKAGEMFIVCGVLYVVDSVEERTTNIRFALDLYKNLRLEDVSIPFTNPFRQTTMIGYNHRNKELYTWDKGNQLTYPIRYHEIGYNVSKEEKGDPEANALNQTDIYIEN